MSRHQPSPRKGTCVNKVCESAAEAVADIPDGASPAVGGFGRGLGVLLAAGRIGVLCVIGAVVSVVGVRRTPAAARH